MLIKIDIIITANGNVEIQKKSLILEVLNLIKDNFFKSAIKTVTKKESGIIDVSIIAPVKCQPLWRFSGLKVLEPHSTKPLNKIIKKRIELIAPAQEEVNGRLSKIFLL